ncbi:MAG: ABC-2 family transporter protein [Oligoflexia bacterium]|nr:ABC-2 family transporter protein [Oligoflexia bacterium]
MKLEWRLAALKNGLQDATAYRIEFIFEFLSAAFVPAAIQWILWYALFKIGGATEIAGMSYQDLLQYTLVSILFTQVRGGDLDFELGEMIRSGQLSNYLLRPVGVVEFVFLRGLAPKLFIAGFCLLLGIVLSFFIDISPTRLVGAMGLALIGNVIYYQLSASLASAAFVWEEAYSLLMVKNMVVNLLSGELLPLNLFPQALSWIWMSAPFYLFVFGPTQYALGRWSHEQFLVQFGISAIWLVIGYGLIRLTWGLGIRRYLSLGG